MSFDDRADVPAVDPGGLRPEPFVRVAPSLGALAWEVEQDTLTMTAVSAAALVVAGYPDHDIVGQSSWMNVLPAEDRAQVIVMGQALQPGERTHISHRLNHADGAVTWMHTSMVGTVAVDGRRTVCGLSVRWEPGTPGLRVLVARQRHARLLVRRRPRRT